MLQFEISPSNFYHEEYDVLSYSFSVFEGMLDALFINYC
jgi:hypothetical protein